MNVDYRGGPLPVRELHGDRMGAVADLHLSYRALASVRVPTGRIVVAFVSDSARLTNLFADHWAQAGADQEPDATLYALAAPACRYGLDDTWDGARWWSQTGKTMAVFGCGSYRLAKTCIRGICSAVSGDDVMFLHGCALSLGAGNERRGVVITGSSGAGKTTLVAKLLQRSGYPITVLNDDWGAVSLSSGDLVNTGERRLHMKSKSVLALRPDFFESAPRSSYLYDFSEPDWTDHLLVSPDSVYRARWNTRGAVIKHVVVILRERPGWVPPRPNGEVVRVLKSGGYSEYFHRHESFFNGSLILRTAKDELREEQHYQRLLNHASLSWINNCGSPDELVDGFISAVSK
jgi:CobW/HypB/UreG, nucleotide-binding domain